MLYLITIFTILFFLLAWRRPDWAVMILIAALPSYLIRFSILGLPLTLLEVMIWIVFLVWFLKNYRRIFKNIKLRVTSYELRGANSYPFDWEIALLIIIAFISAAAAGFSTAPLGVWKAYFFEPAMLFIVVINLMAERKKTLSSASWRIPFRGGEQLNPPDKGGVGGLNLILWPLAVSAFIVSLFAVYQKITGQFINNPAWAAEAGRRVVSFFGYPNAVGLYLGPIVLVIIGWMTSVIASDRRERSNLWSRGINNVLANSRLVRFYQRLLRSLALPRNDSITIAFISLTIIASVLAIYFAKSKGALVSMAAGLIVFGLLAGKKIRWATVAFLIIMTLGIASYEPARALFNRNLALTNKSGQIRQAGWHDTWRMLKDGRLISGAGLANYQEAVAPYHTEGIFLKDYNDPDFQRKLVFNEKYRTAHWQPLEIYLYPHNIFLNFWSELGLAGLLLFIWIFIKYFGMGTSHLVIAAPEPQSRNAGSAENWIAGQARDDNTRWKLLNVGLICAMVAIIIHGVVDVPYFKNDLAILFWLLVAMMGVINLQNIKVISS